MRIPKWFIKAYQEKGEKCTIFGHPIINEPREVLLATIGYLSEVYRREMEPVEKVWEP